MSHHVKFTSIYIKRKSTRKFYLLINKDEMCTSNELDNLILKMKRNPILDRAKGILEKCLCALHINSTS